MTQNNYINVKKTMTNSVFQMQSESHDYNLDRPCPTTTHSAQLFLRSSRAVGGAYTVL